MISRKASGRTPHLPQAVFEKRESPPSNGRNLVRLWVTTLFLLRTSGVVPEAAPSELKGKDHLGDPRDPGSDES